MTKGPIIGPPDTAKPVGSSSLLRTTPSMVWSVQLLVLPSLGPEQKEGPLGPLGTPGS